MALSLTTSGVGLSANVTAVASLANQVWCKWQMKADAIIGLPNGGAGGIFGIDSDGAGTNKKYESYFNSPFDGTHFRLEHGAPGQISNQMPLVLRSAVTTGTFVNCFVGWDQTAFHYYAQVTDTSGTVITDGTNSAIIDFAGNLGALSTTGGANGRATLGTSFFSGPNGTQVFGGFAIYSGTPPAAGSALRWQAPSSGDSNIVAMWKLNDAFGGTSPSTAAATVGGQGLVLTTSQYAWTGGGVWFPPPAVVPPRQVRMISREAIHRSFRW